MDDEQNKLWNGVAGRAWADLEEVTDALFRPIEEVLVKTVPRGSGGRVLDVGCGTGSTTVALARASGAKCVGIDISAPMLEAARARARREGVQAEFVLGSAETHVFEPVSYDKILSRFGVMFFHDPTRAFANMRSAVAPGGSLRCVTWRSPADNDFMLTAERAAAPLLPNLPARKQDGPGQFSLADPEKTKRILDESGWREIQLTPFDEECVMPERELVRFFTRLGMLGRVLPDVDEATRLRVADTVRAAFERYVHGDEVRFTAACWMVSAENR